MNDSSLKNKLGALFYDLPRFLWVMRPARRQFPSKDFWVLMRNRNERLLKLDSGRGVACDWPWTSDLHLADVFPKLGQLLMKRALRDWPIELKNEPSPNRTEDPPSISFVIGHRGLDRLPHLRLTLRSIAAQRGVAFECIVVEQSVRPELRDQLPAWVRYIHTPLPFPEMSYSRAWAFNVAARAARGKVIVLHDNDMLMPMDYSQEILARLQDGYEVINLKRFIFYLTEAHTKAVLSQKQTLSAAPAEAVVQNLEAGGSLAITREAYFAIGGLDETFVGWGGEDNEFWDRAQTRRVWRYAYLPIVHLWHRPQSEKVIPDNPNQLRYQMLVSNPVEARISELTASNFGSTRGSIEDGAASR